MDKLLPIINQLQNVFNTTGTSLVELPQIVVIGEQSSGKSSVLESIAGLSCFPRGRNTCTRCPIVLQMIQKNREAEEYRTLSAQLQVAEWFEFPHLKEKSIVTDFDQVTQIITDEVNRRAGDAYVLVKEELVVRIISPNVINLTLVDLPGLVENPSINWPEDLPQQIIDMVTLYASNPNSIILAVSAANIDIENSKSIKFVKTIDPKGDRTIAVLTKLDQMESGTDATAVLTGQTLKVKLGIVGVVNRSHDETMKGMSIAESIAKEAKFLIDEYPTIASQNGIPNLKIRLQRLLMENIMKTLPILQTRLTNMQIQARKHLEELGDENVNADNKSAIMLEIIEDYCTAFRSSINGKNRHIQKTVLMGNAQLNLALEEDLERSLDTIRPQENLKDELILKTISNSRSIESSVMLIEAAFQDLARNQIELLREPALKCASTVNYEIINIMKICSTLLEGKMQRFPYLSAAIVGEVTELLNERHLVVLDVLKNYVDVQVSFIKTIQKEFNSNMRDFVTTYPLTKSDLLVTVCPKDDGPLQATLGDDFTDMQRLQCDIVRQLVQKYYDIVKTAFQDYCPKAIAHTVIYHMESNVERRLVRKLHTLEKMDELVREWEAISEQRQCATEQIEAVDRALNVIRDVRNTKF